DCARSSGVGSAAWAAQRRESEAAATEAAQRRRNEREVMTIQLYCVARPLGQLQIETSRLIIHHPSSSRFFLPGSCQKVARASPRALRAPPRSSCSARALASR